MKKTPEVGQYLDAEEKALIEAFETSDAPLKSRLTPKRKREIESMARAAMATSAPRSLRASRGETSSARSPARSKKAYPIRQQINALIHRYVSD